jgi:hypothetical protein
MPAKDDLLNLVLKLPEASHETYAELLHLPQSWVSYMLNSNGFQNLIYKTRSEAS